jgi:hypothetical protein
MTLSMVRDEIAVGQEAILNRISEALESATNAI